MSAVAGDDSSTVRPASLRTLISALFVLAAGPVRAEGYYTPTPLLGERAASLAGAFVGVADDPSAAWHNPAGLAALPSSIFGANLDLYELGFHRRAGVLQVGDAVEGADDSRLETVPSAFGVAWVWGGRFGAAASVFVPESDSLSLAASRDDGAASGSRELSRFDRTWLVGPSFAVRVAEGLSVGLSVFYELRLRDETDRLRSAGEGSLRIDLADYAGTHGAVLAVAGALLERGPWRIGLRIAPPSLTVHDALRLYRSQAQGVSPEAPAGHYVRQTFDLPWTVRRPWRGALGVAWRAGAWLVAADLRAQAGGDAFATFDPPAASALPPRVVRPRAMLNGSLGVERAFGSDLALRAGAFTRFAGIEHPDGDEPDAPEVTDQVGATLGFTRRDGATTLTLGLGYAYAFGAAPGVRTVEEGGVPRRVGVADAVTRHALRFSLGGSYAF